MDSAMISKIMKARQYADERDIHMRFTHFTVAFTGDHREHIVNYDDGDWRCTCDFFAQRGVCSHTMALERVLGGTIEAIDLTPALAA